MAAGIPLPPRRPSSYVEVDEDLFAPPAPAPVAPVAAAKPSYVEVDEDLFGAPAPASAPGFWDRLTTGLSSLGQSAAENSVPPDPERMAQTAQSVASSTARGVDQIQGNAYGAVEATGEAVGSPTITEFGREGRVRNKAEADANPQTQDFAGIRSAGDAGQWATETAVSQAPQLGLSIAGGAAGAALGAFGGPAAPVTIPLGAALGAFLPNFVLSVGETQGNIKDKDPNAVAPGYAFAGGSAVAALDTVLPGKIGSRLAGQFGLEVAEQIAKKALAKEVAKEAGTEAITEAVQEAIGEVTAAQATGQDIDPNLPKRMVEAGAGGALVGGGASVITHPNTEHSSPAPSTVSPDEFLRQADQVSPVPPPADPAGAFAGAPARAVQDEGRLLPAPGQPAAPPNVPQGAMPAEPVIGPDPGPGPTPAAPVPNDMGYLLAMGESPENIAAMNPSERAAAVQEAVALKVQPLSPEQVAARMAPPVQEAAPLQGEVLPPEAQAAPAPAPEPAAPTVPDLKALLNDPRPLAEIQAEQAAKVEAKRVADVQAQTPARVAAIVQSLQTKPLAQDDVRGFDHLNDPEEIAQLGRQHVDQAQALIEGGVTEAEQPKLEAVLRTMERARNRIEQLKSEARLSYGTPSAPIQLNGPEDVHHNAHLTESPTPAQAESGRYQKRRVKWQGLGIHIETEQGAERTGVDPDGKPWSVTMPAPYGGIDRSKGADKDPLDVYVGPQPKSETVFVIDQIDPATGKFDETKSVIGTTSPEEAQAIYNAAFSDGRGPDRMGAITPMSVAQFKAWVKNGNHKKPVAYKPTREKKAFKKEPKTLLQHFSFRGGIAPDPEQKAFKGELAARDLHRTRVPGFGWGNIVKKGGMQLDKARELATDLGYLPSHGTVDDLLNLMEREAFNKGEVLTQAQERDSFAAPEEQDPAEHEKEVTDALIEDILASGALSRSDIDDATLARAVEIVMGGEPSLEIAWERAVVEQGRDVPEVAAVLQTEHIPFDEEEYDGPREADWTPTDDDWRSLSESSEPFGGPGQGPVGEAGQDGASFGGRETPEPADRSGEAREQVDARDDGPITVEFSDWRPIGEGYSLREGRHRDGIDQEFRTPDGNIISRALDRDGKQVGMSFEGAGNPFAKGAMKWVDKAQDDLRRLLNPQITAPDEEPAAAASASDGKENTATAGAEASSEVGADGKPQLVIPGAEQIGQGEHAQRKANEALKPKVDQKDTDGLALFGDGHKQTDIFDAPPKKEEPKAAEPAKPKKEADKPAIADFGEKIAGAKKDLVRDFSKSLSDDEIDIAAEPLSKVFPQPDYEKLAEAGVSRSTLSTIALLRNAIPAKPRKGWKLDQWVKSVRLIRGLADQIANGNYSTDEILKRMRESALRRLADTADVLANSDIEPKHLALAAEWSVQSAAFSSFNGQRFDKPKTKYYVNDGKGRQTRIYGDTLDDVREPFIAAIKGKLPQDGAKTEKRTKLSIYQSRADKELYIGFKGLSGVVRLKAGFASVKDARSYMEEHADDLQAQIDQMRKGPSERRLTNNPRVGEARREGDVSPEQFGEMFGFRGVQFGNYVESTRRQQDLNEAFDALMDLAITLGIPARALSLNGQLGLAFGARGSGRAMAHYEAGHVVINLTKTKGAGSLAHEWFHAVDHYFANQDDGKKGSDFMTDRAGRKPAVRGEVREAVYKAFEGIHAALRKGSYRDRMGELDAAKAKPYWSQMIEMAARGFERYVTDRIEAKGGSNDYLANIDKNEGAYPTDKEMQEQGITAAFDKLFDTLDTRETEKGVELFNTVPQGWDVAEAGPTHTLSDKAIDQIAEIIERVSGLKRFTLKNRIWIGPSPGARAWGSEEGGEAAGSYRVSLKDAAHDLITMSRSIWDELGVRTAYHESFHRLQTWFLTDQERAILKGAEAKLRSIVAANEGRKEQAAKMSRREIEAESFALYMTEPAKTGFAAQVKNVFAKIGRLLRALNNWRKGQGFQTWEDVFERAASGEMAKRAPRSEPVTNQSAEFSRIPNHPNQPFETPDTRSTHALAKMFSPSNWGQLTEASNWKDLVRAGQRFWQDKFVDLKTVQENITKASGQPVPLAQDAYLMESLYHGRTGEKLEDFYNGDVKAVMEMVRRNKLTPAEVDDYLIALHVEERNAQIASLYDDPAHPFVKALTDRTVEGGSGHSLEWADQIKAKAQQQGKTAILTAIARKVRQITNADLAEREAVGLLSADATQAMRDTYKNYVPLRGWELDESDGHPGTGRGLDTRGAESKRALGRRSKADSPLAYVLSNRAQGIIRAEKNKVAKTFLRLVESNPNKNLWEVNRKELVRTLNSEGKVAERDGPPSRIADNVFIAKVGGKEVYVTIHDPHLARAMKNMDAENLGVFLKGVNKITRLLAALNTGWNIEWFVPNLVRDLQTAAIQIGDEGMPGLRRAMRKNWLPAIRGAFEYEAGKTTTTWGAIAKDFADNGGKVNFVDLRDLEWFKSAITKEATESNLTRMLKKGFRLPLNAFEGVTSGVENAIRIAAYKALIDRGVPKAKAASVARELTVNFNRKGNASPFFNALYMFFNAAVQGHARLAKTLYTNKTTRYAVLAGLPMLGIIEALLGAAGDDDDKDEYGRLEAYVRERNFVVMLHPLGIPGTHAGQYVKLPIPYGFNVFKVLGTEVGRVLFHGAPPSEAAIHLFMSAFAQANVFGGQDLATALSPTVTDPFVEIAENKKFTGSQIKPNYPNDKRPPSEQYFPTVSNFSKAVTAWLNEKTGGNTFKEGAISISPEHLDHLISAYAGGVGRLLVNGEKFVSDMMAGKPIDPEKTPLLRQVYGDTTSEASTYRAFREVLQKVEAVEAEVKGQGKAGNQSGAKEAQTRDPALWSAIGPIKAADKQLDAMRTQERVIRGSSLSDSEKDKKLDELREQQHSIQRKALDAWDKAHRKKAA